MNNIVDIKYDRMGTSSSTDARGMREMQAMAYEVREQQYMLI